MLAVIKKDIPLEDMAPGYIHTSENIFNLTGCRPTEAKDIKIYKLYKDQYSTKYLYGSKYKDGVESFWFSKYNSCREQQWGIVHKDPYLASYAYGPI